MEEKSKYEVCVECMTYNQALYIKDTLEGFCNQQTSFPYVCVVMDDASTDGEQTVISEYLAEHFNLDNSATVRKEETENYTMTFAQNRENPLCYFAVYFLKYNHYQKRIRKESYYSEWRNSAKYMAMCEGDDYWTFSTKLQRQHDYLESHPEVVLSCHRYTILDTLTGQEESDVNSYFDQKKHAHEELFEFDLNYYLHTWITKTLTIMYRRTAFKDDYYVGYKYPRDVHFNYYVMTKGKGVCHAFNGGLYRKGLSTSVYGNLDKAARDNINCKVYEELAEVTKDPIAREVADNLLVLDCMNRLKPIGGGIFMRLSLCA